ncbi:methyl-accepting chemotaxis protein [Heyndrickxia ginsengihumi]|uniref:methyl-accepting chemotaxis protein n=1 Tax=Heyndrickxia ginsengihumi TaxID=363870 RepID=UPI000471DE26|nr:methyl-accepting chemotaxis protein [Heyndrickxia ginsengihumi]
MSTFKNMSIRSQINLIVVSTMLVLSGVLAVIVHGQVSKGIKHSALAKAKGDVKLAYLYLETKYPGEWHIENGNLYKGSYLMNGNNALVDGIGKATGDTVTLFQHNTRIATNISLNGKREIGTKASEAVTESVLQKGKSYFGDANVLGKDYQTAYIPIKDHNGKIIGMFYVGASELLVSKTIHSIFMIFLTVLAVLVALSISIIILYTNRLRRRIQQLSGALTEAGKGNFTVDITDNRKDEIGQLTSDFNTMKTELSTLIEKVRENTEQLRGHAVQLSGSADQTSKASEEIRNTIQELAFGMENQFTSIEKTSHVVQNVSGIVDLIDMHTKHSLTKSKETSERAIKGNSSIKYVVEQIQLIERTVNTLAHMIEVLGNRSNEIGNITELITNIADETNLLALNANIEAARAGEHGLGFAVVADQVRRLSEQSRRSAEKIASLITSTQQDTNEAVKSMNELLDEVQQGIDAVNEAGVSFFEISNMVQNIEEAIRSISNSSSELYRGTKHIIELFNTIEQVAQEASTGTQNVSATTKQQLASMEEIASSSEVLSQMAKTLQTAVQRFHI